MARSNLKNFAQETGMTYDAKRMLAYGEYQGYQLVIKDATSQKVFFATMNMNGGTPEQVQTVSQYLLTLPQAKPYVKFANFDTNTISISVKSRGKNNIDNLREVLDIVTSYCRGNAMVSCCEFCDSQTDLGMYSINGQCRSMCSSCFEKAQVGLSQAQQEIKEKKGNVFTGIVGALLGSLIGVALWVIVYQLGYIAGIVGLVMTVCCMKGYVMFGGKLDIAGLIISLVIAVVMLYFAENIALAVEIYNQFKGEYDITFISAFRSIPEFLKEADVSQPFFTDLGIGYLLMIVTSISVIRSTYRQANLQSEMTRLS